MRFNPLPKAPRPLSRARLEATLFLGSFLTLSGVYFAAALFKAQVTPLWMDEVLAVSTARLPSFAAIWSAVWGGAEFSPPTFAYLLHGLMWLSGTPAGTLGVRIPSIVALYLAALCIYALLRPRTGRFVALVALGCVLASGLFPYAIQARPYALMALALAAGLLIWQGFERSQSPWARALGLWLVLFAGLSLHFYGVVELGAFVVAELLWLGSRRQFRWPVWLALVAVGGAEAVWYPLASHLATFNVGDTFSSNYYAKPTPDKLAEAIFSVLIGGRLGALFLACAAALIAYERLMRRRSGGSAPRTTTEERLGPDGVISTTEIIMAALCAIPFMAFIVAVLFTRSFSERYAVPAALFCGIAIAYLLGKASARRFTALALIPIVALAIVTRAQAPPPDQVKDSLAALQTAPQDSAPIVIGEALLFIELMEAADPKTRGRLVYLLSSPGSVSPDPTNENQLSRILPLHPEYQVSAQEVFLKRNKQFYLLFRPYGSTDMTTPGLIEKGLLDRPLSDTHDVLLFAAGAPATSACRDVSRGAASGFGVRQDLMKLPSLRAPACQNSGEADL